MQDTSTNGLVITQGMLPADRETRLGQFVIADPLEQNSNLSGMVPSYEEVAFGEVTGHYAEGTWNLTEQGPV